MDIFAKIKEYYRDELSKVNDIFLSFANSDVELANLVTNHLMSSGGKRIRPLLTIMCAKLTGVQSENIPLIAAAIECIHAATLLHDDVIDESAMRRGIKTANNIWGNKASILVGDFLLGKAFQLLVQSGSIKALELFSNTSVQLAEAEIWQLALINGSEKLYTISDYMKLVEGKTSKLFAAACAAPTLLNNSAHYDSLYDFGMNLGHLFQLADDTLDYAAQDAKFGKTIGNDILEGKITLPFLMMLKDATDQGDLMLKMQEKDRDYILAQFQARGTLTQCREFYASYGNICSKLLKIFPDSEGKQHLNEVIAFLMNRSY